VSSVEWYTRHLGSTPELLRRTALLCRCCYDHRAEARRCGLRWQPETERLESLLSALKVYSGDASLSIASLQDTPSPDSSDGPPGGKGSKANGDLAAASQGLDDEVPLVDLSANGHQSSSDDDSSLPTIQRSVGPTLVVKGLTITLPRSGEVLFPQGLSFGLGEDQSLLVMGPSGCGKSSLLRVISGLWSTGTGSVQCPREKGLFFLPQKPYMTIGR